MLPNGLRFLVDCVHRRTALASVTEGHSHAVAQMHARGQGLSMSLPSDVYTCGNATTTYTWSGGRPPYSV